MAEEETGPRHVRGCVATARTQLRGREGKSAGRTPRRTISCQEIKTSERMESETKALIRSPSTRKEVVPTQDSSESSQAKSRATEGLTFMLNLVARSEERTETVAPVSGRHLKVNEPPRWTTVVRRRGVSRARVATLRVFAVETLDTLNKPDVTRLALCADSSSKLESESVSGLVEALLTFVRCPSMRFMKHMASVWPFRPQKVHFVLAWGQRDLFSWKAPPQP